MRNIYRKYKYILLLVTGSIIVSCSTEKNTTSTRLYHNLTTHYNVYFNGEKSYKEGVKKAESDIEDNFNLILPVFLYYNENISQSVFSNMDRAVKKATKAITLHSITAKPEMKKGEITEQDKEFFERNEYNKWIDDSYLLIGKSYMFQQEYGLAKDAFKHVINKYPYESTVYNAKIWLTRCYNAKNSFKESEMMINTLHNDAEFPKKLKGDLDISIADYYIKQNKYDEAIPYLEKALKTIRKKYYRIRYTYILGQLYQKTNNHKQSFDTYGKVIKMNPPYLMTFNAKINRAGVFNAQAGDSREIKTQLYKMLKDDKNIDYRDQIYYALGNVSYKEGNIGEAVENYKKSVQASQGNSNQIALSYKKLASIYYERSDYEEAQVYYDSTLTFIGQEYPDYKTIYARAKVLNKLVNYLHAVHLQDSLLRLAEMSEKERLAVIDQVIKDYIYQEQQAKQQKQQAMQEQAYNRRMLMENQELPNTTSSSTGGKWYFYNPAAKGFGQAEFKMKWGNRKLEDNWRRKNKRSLAPDEDLLVDTESEEQEDPKKNMDVKSREYYLVDIPLTDSAREQSRLKIQKGLYNAGLVYRNDLNEIDLAIESFKELTTRYPESDYAVATFYNLYQIYQIKGDKEKEILYKNIIINNFPGSNYAKVLTDPDYLKKIEEKEKESLNHYLATFNKFKMKRYSEVINDAEHGLEKYPDDPVAAKFMYLKALSIGYLYDDDLLLKDALDQLIKKYPGDEASAQAKETIEHLEKTSEKVIKEVEKQEIIAAKEIYLQVKNTVHYFAFIAKKSTNIDQLTFNIINYNIDFYTDINLNTNGEEINTEHDIVQVKEFKSALEATRYMNKIIAYEEIYRDVQKENLEAVIISAENLKRLKEDKNVSRYIKFYKSFYK